MYKQRKRLVLKLLYNQAWHCFCPQNELQQFLVTPKPETVDYT